MTDENFSDLTLDEVVQTIGSQATNPPAVSIGGDPSGQYPSYPYQYRSTVNLAANGNHRNSLQYVAAIPNSVSPVNEVSSIPGLNKVQATAGGHTIEMDDTPGNERILIRHTRGAGIEVGPDGSVSISSHGRQVLSVGGDQTITIEGNANLIYNGSVSMSVAGDFNLDVAGNYNVTANSTTEKISGNSSSTIDGNQNLTVKGNKSVTVLGRATNIVLGSFNNIVKGTAKYISQGTTKISSATTMLISGKTQAALSGDNVNVFASNLSVVGSTGSVGGGDMMFYGAGGNYTDGVTAPTFHGDLDGNAANTYAQSYAYTLTSGGGSITNTATPTAPINPSSSQITQYLNEGSLGAADVSIDVDNSIFNNLNKLEATGGIRISDMTTSQARSALRDTANRNNSALVGDLIGRGVVGSSFANPAPAKIGRVSSNSGEAFDGYTPLGGLSVDLGTLG